jgi:diguanylate cyclase (GGDEF)-like protein
MSVQTIAADAWTEILGPLRSRYVDELPLALAQMERCLGRLDADPADAEALATLLRRFHSTAGSGGTYGFPGLSALCARGEAECNAFLAAGAVPDAEQLERWHMLLYELRLEVAAAAAPPAPQTSLSSLPSLYDSAERSPGTSAAAGTGARARILSMEDDPAQALYIRTVLEGAGYQVTPCDDPRRFAAELAATRPDLVLMDVVLPQSSGYELVRSLRHDSGSASLPVLFLTTEGQMNARVEAAWAGGDDHLVKPVPPALLLAQIAERLDRSRRVQALFERDALTRLLARDTFLARAREAVARKSQDSGARAVWAMLDVDLMKPANHLHGRKAGDRVLAAAANRLRHQLPTGSVAGRYGGDRIAVLFDGLRLRPAAALIDEFRRDFAAVEHRGNDSSNGATFRVTVSAGLAELGTRDTLDSWIAAADRALHQAKSTGRNRVQLA